MNKKPGQAVAALGAEVMDRGLRSQRGREDNRSGWASRQTGLASGRETESKQEHPAFSGAVILSSFLFIQRLGMRLNNCQLDIYYRCISLDRGP